MSPRYSAKDLIVLEGLEAVRKRPAMYIGSTDTKGLMHCLWEIIDNSVDEALAGYGNLIKVELHSDGSVSVIDQARGIPVDVEPKTGLTGVEVVFTRLHAGGKFSSNNYAVSGGLHGVGSSVVNALSARLDVEIDRDGYTWAMSFQAGTPGIFDGFGPNAKFKAAGGLQKIKKCPKTRTGTRVRYWPDPQIFIKSAELSWEKLVARARQTAFLVPGLRIEITDSRLIHEDQPITETFEYHGGISEFCDYLSKGDSLCEVLRLQGSEEFVETVSMPDAKGIMQLTDVTRECQVDIALRWSNTYDTVEKSFVNIIATPKGGTHVTGFERGMTRAFTKALEGTRILKSGEEVIKDDILEGLTAVITVKLAEPQFEGQTKEVLGTAQAQKITAKVAETALLDFLTSTKPTQRAQARTIMEKAVNASRTRVAARTHKENQRRKNALEASSLPAKLSDCRSNDLERSELFIVEGDSALGTAKLARNSEYQALLPIRGKILNVQKKSTADMLKNKECASIIQVVGGGSGSSFDLDSVRYGKIIFMADADADGSHIRCLLATLFFKYMRPLVEAGRVYTAVPPLHRFELLRPKKGQERYLYTYSDAEYQRKLIELQRKGIAFKEPQRYKGLGEMDADQLANTTMNPKYRTLRRLTIDQLEEASEMFEVLMGEEVNPRREFIVSRADLIDNERIDA